ncbi:hypothetical protein [Streptomyces sp. NPDC004284]|uniref:hypothetical protein n=1 Tax=Streptomyces sp. NPDC004284 TaxID=3364695 RepID=UPI0036CA98E2
MPSSPAAGRPRGADLRRAFSTARFSYDWVEPWCARPSSSRSTWTERGLTSRRTPPGRGEERGRAVELIEATRYDVLPLDDRTAERFSAEIAFAGGPVSGAILAQGGTVSLYYDGDTVGEGRAERTLPLIFSADGTADVGVDAGTPVVPDYDTEHGAFTGDNHWVELTAGPNDADRHIRPEDRIRIAMGRQ